MGRRGPIPRSGVMYAGMPVVMRGTAPSILVGRGARESAIADRRGYASIHRLVASQAIGRWVTRDEAVEAIDGDPWNWDPRNLRVRSLAASLPRPRPAPKPTKPTKSAKRTKPAKRSR